MRCLPIRSVLRAAIAAGLISSCQHATVQASWKDFLPTSIGTCYVHDLAWDRFQTNPHLVESIVKPVDLEADMCLAAVKQFELKMQIDAIIDSLKSKSRMTSQFAASAIIGLAQTRRLLVETVKNHEWRVIEIPKTVDDPQVAGPSADQVLDLGYDWNCGDWCRDRKPSELASLPTRDRANLFVYALDEITSTQSLEKAVDYADAGYADADNSEANDSEVDYIEADYAGIDAPSAVYGTIEEANINESVVDEEGTSYAGLDAEDLGPEAEHFVRTSDRTDSLNPWQVGVDPVCPEIQSGVPSHSVCCPVESENEAKANAIATVLPTSQSDRTEVQSELQIAVRPPRLDAEFDSGDTALVLAGDGDEPFEQYANEYGNPWLNSPGVFQLNCRLGRRFAFGDNAPRMPKFVGTEGGSFREDIQVDSRFSSEPVGDPILNADSVDTTLSRSTFSSKDFLTTLHSSTYGSILLPVSKSHRTAVDYAMQLLAQPNSESRVMASHTVANQIRSVGQFLLNFANQIEQQAEQIDVARRENNQR